MAKILVLGGSNTQLNAILRIKEKGHTVILADYLKDALGRLYCDYHEPVSTFDAAGCLAVGRKHGVDGVLTVGTDQPVLTCAQVARELNLPSLIDVETALAATNKRIMKEKFRQYNIPTPEYRFIGRNFRDNDLQGLRFPLVIKPLDSQGQRGVYKVNSLAEIRNFFDDVASYSREDQILAEEYYESDEITISGWVEDDRMYILTVTDRITMQNGPHIGICIAHEFPSRYLSSHYAAIQSLSAGIVKNFAVHNGPFYFQMLVGQEGIKVNEVALRIGGAYEDELIPVLTGFDILDAVIENALGQPAISNEFRDYDILANNKYAAVELIFARPGTIQSLPDLEKLKKLPGVLAGRFNYQAGARLGRIENATQRVGYLIFLGKTKKDLETAVREAYDRLAIISTHGINMVLKRKI